MGQKLYYIYISKYIIYTLGIIEDYPVMDNYNNENIDYHCHIAKYIKIKIKKTVIIPLMDNLIC